MVAWGVLGPALLRCALVEGHAKSARNHCVTTAVCPFAAGAVVPPFPRGCPLSCLIIPVSPVFDWHRRRRRFVRSHTKTPIKYESVRTKKTKTEHKTETPNTTSKHKTHEEMKFSTLIFGGHIFLFVRLVWFIFHSSGMGAKRLVLLYTLLTEHWYSSSKQRVQQPPDAKAVDSSSSRANSVCFAASIRLPAKAMVGALRSYL